MKTQPTILITNGKAGNLSLYQLVDQVTESLAPATLRNKSFVFNDIPEDICIWNNEELVASILSNLLGVVVMHTENSRIRITAKTYGNVVLLHVKDDGCLSYDSISQSLTKIQSLAERLGGFVGFTSYRNRLTTIAFSFMNIQAAS